MTYTIKKFVVITMARTGSNALMSALMKHPNLYADYEIFHKQLISGLMEDRCSIEERNADPVGFLSQAVDLAVAAKPQSRAYGFKIFFGHNDKLLEQLIKDPDYSIVVLRRHNILDQYLSLEIARQTNQWTSRKGAKTQKITMTEKAFISFYNQVNELYSGVDQSLERSGKQAYSLCYEDVANENYDDLCDFLELDRHDDLRTGLKKQNPTCTADKVTNPRAVRKMLKKHGLLHLWVEEKGQEKSRPFKFLNFFRA